MDKIFVVKVWNVFSYFVAVNKKSRNRTAIKIKNVPSYHLIICRKFEKTSVFPHLALTLAYDNVLLLFEEID